MSGRARSTSISRSPPARTTRCARSTPPRSPPATRTTAVRGSAPCTTPATTARSSWTPTGTTSKSSTTTTERPREDPNLGPWSHRALVSPPVALTLHVFARILAEIGRTEDEDLEALRPALVASPRAGRDAHHVPLLDLDDLVVELHPPAPAHDDVHLLLLLVRVAVREAIVGRDALVAEAGLLEPERLACVAELQVRRAVEVGPDVVQILFEVPERERHGRDPTVPSAPRRAPLCLCQSAPERIRTSDLRFRRPRPSRSIWLY